MFKLISNSIVSNRCWLLLAVLTNLSIPVTEAGTIVRVETLVGSFAIELFDDVAPLTTANFLNYVNSGRYNGTFVHRSEPGFVIQGGNWSFDEDNQVFFEIETDDPVVNEFNISNTRGTIAMAKLGNNPDSATNEWFINLADNLSLDSSNGGFTVFGEILGNGMEVVDAIAALPVGRTQVIPFNIPIIDFTGGTLENSNLVNVEISVLPNVYDSQTGILTLSVDAQ